MGSYKRLRWTIPALAFFTISGCSAVSRHVTLQREASLRRHLYDMRRAVDRYTMDRNRSPQALDDLVHAGYLPEIPIDPFTHSRAGWVPERGVVAGSQPGIVNVKSSSKELAIDL
jgi:hypothetical protein